MYCIEQNGDSIFGMPRFLMMENAGHGVADFVVRKMKNLKSKIIVAVCGTGIKGEIRQPYASAIDAINKSKAYVLAVDVPSGFDPNTGQIHKKCIMADATITFHRLKSGLAEKKKKKYTGSVYVEWIGIPPEAEKGIV